MQDNHSSSLNSSRGIKFAIIVGLLLISFSIFYYFVIFLPQKSTQQLEQKVQLEGFDTYKQVKNQQNLDACLDEVNQRFAKMEVPEGQGKNLSAEEAKVATDLILDLLKQAKDECYKKYPTN